jgi:T5SS/PEP-CTERM-associated repeat protein/autotransporter-associated beta strand protein
MKNPTRTPITRASLLATASFNTRWLTRVLVGTTALGSTALAVDNLWDGSSSTDWNDATNWSLNRVPVNPSPGGFDDAVINLTTPVATLSATPSAGNPRDVIVGRGAAGRFDHVSGTLSTGNGNYVYAGQNGASGVYNLANTAVAVPTGPTGPYSGFGPGSGNLMTSNGGQLRVGQGNGATGTFNVNTTGRLNVGEACRIGLDGSVATPATGVMNFDGGAMTVNNWFVLGAGTGNTGTLNLSGGTITKTGGNHLILGDNGATGVVNVTGGRLSINNECWIGQNGGKGTVNLSGGEIFSTSYVQLGRTNAAGSEGTLNHSGGTWNKLGGNPFIVGDNGKGTYNLSGTGAVTVFGDTFVGQGATGNGTLAMTGGTVTTNGWNVIGREGGTGLVNMSGGTWRKIGGNQLIVGSSGPGTMNLTNGLVDVQGGFTWVGENAGATTATLNLSATGEWRTHTMSVGQNTTTLPGAVLNLNGGTVRTQRFIGARESNDTGTSAGTGTINFNGSQIIATASNVTNFISNTVDNAVIGNTGGTGSTGGLRVDSNGFNLVAPKVLTGSGGVVKSGRGTLNLSGVSSYSGSNTINAGGLTLNGDSSGTGDITVADGARLGITQVNAANSLDPVNVTFGTAGATSLNLDLGNFAGNPTAAPLNVTGTLTLNGTVTINITDQLPAVGTGIPLVSYVGTKGGSGSFVLGSLPDGVSATLNDNGTGSVTLDITDITVVQPVWHGNDAPKYTRTADVVNGSADVLVTDASNIAIGQKVFGSGIAPGATVSAITGTTITLDLVSTGDFTGTPLLFTTATGSADGVWDVNTTTNWVDSVTSTPSDYDDRDPVLFNDASTGTTSVVLAATVIPNQVTFANNTLDYTLNGAGKISGFTGLTKSGSGNLNIDTANDYTGVTTLSGGITTVDTLTNGGVASPLGAASAAASNLVLAGGTLEYTGGAVTTDRGISILAANNGVVSGLTHAEDVTITGPISSTLGKLVKSGAGTLTLGHAGDNILAVGSDGDGDIRAFRLAEGELVMGIAGQTTKVFGRTSFGSASATTSVTLANGATFIGNGRSYVAENAGADATVTISGTSHWLNNDVVQIGLGNGSVGRVIIQDSGSLTKTGGWISIGNSSNGEGIMTVRDSGTLLTNGDFNIGDVDTSKGTLNIENAGKVISSGNVFIGKNGTNGTLNMSGTGSMVSGDTNVAGNSASVGRLNIGGNSTYMSNSRLQVGPGAGSDGKVVIEGFGSMQVNSYTSVGFGGGGEMTVRGNGKFLNTDDFSVNESGAVPATVTVTENGTLSMVRTLYVGRNATRVGTLNVTGSGTLNQLDQAYSCIVGPAGTGTLTIDDTATMNVAAAGGMVITNNATGTGTVNLDGGTLAVRKVSDAGGNSTFHFNGGVLKAAAGADINFMAGLNTLDVKPGGAFIDTNGQTIAIGQSIGDANGNLTKQGEGTLQLNAGNAYFGSTTVAQGTLGGTGGVAGELIVNAGASINPGAGGVGTFTVDDSNFVGTSIAGTYVCEINGATADHLSVGDALDITGATIDFNVLAAPAATSYVIASYVSLTGNPAIEVDVPAGFEVNYGANQITLDLIPTPYTIWASGHGLNPLTDGAPGADKDGDGQSNGLEFALGGSPVSGSDNAKIFQLAEDSSDGGTNKELLMTIAVRSGTPAFSPTNGGLPTASLSDGYYPATYTIQGSPDLSSFTGTVSVVTAVAPPAPNATAPAGYEWRTFSLEGSDGLPTKGFLRVNVTP